MYMKKEYIKPLIKNFVIDDEPLLALSGDNAITGNVDDDPQIGYGGVDGTGEKDPEAKQGIAFNVWEEDNPNLIYDVWSD